MIEIEHLAKQYGKIIALDNVCLLVKEGETVGILGANGAGKTTLVSIISALRTPTSGTVRVNGLNLLANKQKIKGLIGIVFQENSLDKKLTVKENLTLPGALFGFKGSELTASVEKAIKEFELGKMQDRVVGTLSGGERQLVEISKCLLHNPSLFIFDEPTVGLDPKIRHDIWGKIQAIGKNRKNTIIITSHYLEEIEHLCERVIVINKGKIVLDDKLSNIQNESKTRLCISFKQPVTEKALEKIFGCKVQQSGNNYCINLSTAGLSINEITSILSKNNLGISSIGTEKESLESIYLNLVGDQK